MTVDEFKELLNVWKIRSWLCNHDFSCDDSVIEESIFLFESDYRRWYPNDLHICVYHLSNTPQLIAMLLYRISRLLYIKGLDRCAGGVFATCPTYWSNRIVFLRRYWFGIQNQSWSWYCDRRSLQNWE